MLVGAGMSGRFRRFELTVTSSGLEHAQCARVLLFLASSLVIAIQEGDDGGLDA